MGCFNIFSTYAVDGYWCFDLVFEHVMASRLGGAVDINYGNGAKVYLLHDLFDDFNAI
jgi:hypothetical protein